MLYERNSRFGSTVPELPDIENYLDALRRFVVGKPLEKIRLASPFLLRTVDPPIAAIEGKKVTGVRRLGKRVVLEVEGELFVVIHLMIAGRLRWKPKGQKLSRRLDLAAFDFADGTVLFTEASKKKRASLHLVRGEANLADHDPGGIQPLECSLEEFGAALTAENHTLKRTLTDPTVFSGIGNAYSDEILWAAKLSPIKWTQRLSKDEISRLYDATRETLVVWRDRLRAEVGDAFPDKVTAFHDEMAVHGKYKSPCPRCGSPVQRIVRADNEMNYCATCQNEGQLLADRSLSRLLKGDWPKTLDELEEYKRARQLPERTPAAGAIEAGAAAQSATHEQRSAKPASPGATKRASKKKPAKR
jgi:formamidopyrimidine-DNA glycosylase